MSDLKELYTAIIKAQSKIRVAIKDSTNPHFRSKYADLASVWDAVRDALHSNGLAVVQLSRIHESGAPVLITRIIHTSGQHIEGEYPLVCKDPTDPQKLVAATTYARRASLSAALGVIADDDDGNTAASAPKEAPQPKTMKEVFEAFGVRYPEQVEALFGKSVNDFTAEDKSKARELVNQLKAGKPWSTIMLNTTMENIFK